MSTFQPRSRRFKLFTQAILPLALMLAPGFPGKLFAQATQPPDQAWQMRFDGNDAVVMPVDAVKSLGSAFTLQIWVYPEQRSFMMLAERFLDDPDSDPNVSFQWVVQADGTVRWGQSTGTPGSRNAFASTTALPLKQWSHVAVTFDGTVTRGYINGVQFAQKNNPGAVAVSNQSIHVGATVRPANVANPGFNFSGVVGMLRQFGIWNRALSAAEIRSAMTTLFAGSESGLVGFWPMDDGLGYTFRDLTAAGKTASLLYSNRVKLINGNANNPVIDQYWPIWFQPSVWNASPFVWTEQTQGPTENFPNLMVPIDFDHDGDLDLVTGAFWNPNLPLTTLKAYRNDGKGNFTEATQEVFGASTIPSLAPVQGFAADLNHDGRADLVIPDYGSDYFCCHPVPGGTHVFIQTSDGRLVDESATRAPVRDNSTHDSDAADIDGDGSVDVYLSDIKFVADPPYFRMALLKNDGSGHFTVDNSRLPQSLAKKITFASRFLDANGDGFPDLFLSAGFSDTDLILLNDGTGHFQDMIPGALPPKIGGSNSETRRVAVGDLNGDGFPDLVLSSEAAKLSGWQILINRGDGTFDDRTSDWLPDTLMQRSTLPATEIAISGEMILRDLNGDGYPDLLVEWGTYSRLYMNNGQRLVDTSSFLPYMPGGQFAVADFDGDGRPDVVYGRRDSAGNALLLVGLNKRDYAVSAPAAPLNPPVPQIGPVSIHNDGSGSAETLAPGTRIRIIGKNLGPAAPVTVAEAPGVVLPSTLGGVTVTFDSTPARLISVSATELVAIVPFAVSGQWMTMVQVSYQGRVSQPVGMFVIESNPMVYAKADPGKQILPYYVAEAWKVNGTQRTKVTQAGQITWGDRIAIRLTGAGQGQNALTDDTVTQTRAFTPVNPVPVFLGNAGGFGSTPPSLAPVSMTWAPDGLAGIVEIVLDIPTAAAAANYGAAFFVPELMNNGSPAARTLRWPFDGPATGCTYALSSGGQTIGGQAFPATGGPGSITVTTQADCQWSVGNLPVGVSLASAGSGTGSGTVTFQVSSGAGMKTFTVAGLTFTVEQQPATISGLGFVGSMPHIAAEENWTTAFTLVNKSAATVQSRLSLFGDPNGLLTLPLTFPQQTPAPGALLAASFDRTLAANASLIVNTSGPRTPPVQVGSAQLASTGSVDGFAIFHQIVTAQEAVVPLETRNASSYLLAFDNTNGLVLGVAVENVSAQAANIPVVIRDDSGTQIASGSLPSLAGSGHTSFVLSTQFPATANKRGTIEFDTPTGGQISVLGIRFTPPNNALTTIPALANVGTGGGSIAHLASGGDGWQTTFVLVNTGTSSAQATLSFFADQTGAPMLLPLTFPQGNLADTAAPSVTQTLVAGATLVIVSSGAPNLLTGSAQLSTAGHVSGFVIFRHNNQEAVVPLESRNAGAYILAFDNTAGTATGVAVNAVSTQPVNVPVVVRNDAGTQIASGSIDLTTNGHSAFTLGVDKFPETAGIRGTLEFGAPANAKIGALGIRIPVGIAHTFTTLPALAK